MSSDKIKDALVAAYSGTSAKDWKRRTKTSVDGKTQRDFEHPQHGTVSTFEAADGSVTLGSNLAQKITETGQKLVREIAAKIGSSTDSILLATVDALGIESEMSAAERKELASIRAAAPKPELGPLAVGDKIQIPAGTDVFELDYSDDAESCAAVTRTVTATLARTFKAKNWITFAPADHIAAVEAAMSKVDGRNNAVVRYLLEWIRRENEPIPRGFSGHPTKYSRSAEVAAALLAAQAAVKERFGDNLEFAVWGSGSNQRAAHISKIVKIADAAQVQAKKAAAPKEAKITKRRQMVVGSKWRFTRDVEFNVWTENPKIAELIRKRDAISRSPHSHRQVGGTLIIGLGGGNPNTPAEEATMKTIQGEINRLSRDESQIMVKAGSVKAGTVITVMDKLTPGYKSYGDKETNGLLVPCVVTTGEINSPSLSTNFYGPTKKGEDWRGNRIKGYNLPFKQIEDAVEALEIPEEIVYVLRDSATGEFFGGWETELDGRWNRGTNKPKMSKTFSGAKKYKTNSAAKASIRDFTGYNAGLNDDGESADAYWAVGGDKKIDLPATWELVAIDKTTNAEKEIFDVQAWFKNLMRLRVLTQKYCSAVRGVYKKAEEDTEHQYEAIVLFQNRDTGSVKYQNGNSSTWDTASPFEGELDEGKGILDAIKKAAGNMGGKTIRVKTQSAVAYACSLEDGVTAKMMFTYPNVITRLLDITTLEDVVGSGAEVAKPVTREYVIDGVTHSY